MTTPDPGRSPVLIDTMIIIAAVASKCWSAIAGSRSIQTVAECFDETQRGRTGRRGYIPVNESALKRVERIEVSELERAAFLLAYDDALGLDLGERDLVAHLLIRNDVPLICTCDKAAVRAVVRLGHGGQLVSLEELAERSGHRPNPALADRFSNKWLHSLRGQYLLDELDMSE